MYQPLIPTHNGQQHRRRNDQRFNFLSTIQCAYTLFILSLILTSISLILLYNVVMYDEPHIICPDPITHEQKIPTKRTRAVIPTCFALIANITNVNITYKKGAKHIPKNIAKRKYTVKAFNNSTQCVMDNSVYTIMSVLGKGAYGIVYKARQESDKALVAMKFFEEAPEYVSIMKENEATIGMYKVTKHQSVEPINYHKRDRFDVESKKVAGLVVKYALVVSYYPLGDAWHYFKANAKGFKGRCDEIVSYFLHHCIEIIGDYIWRKAKIVLMDLALNNFLIEANETNFWFVVADFGMVKKSEMFVVDLQSNESVKLNECHFKYSCSVFFGKNFSPIDKQILTGKDNEKSFAFAHLLSRFPESNDVVDVVKTASKIYCILERDDELCKLAKYETWSNKMTVDKPKINPMKKANIKNLKDLLLHFWWLAKLQSNENLLTAEAASKRLAWNNLENELNALQN